MPYRDFQQFLQALDTQHELRRIAEPISPYLEITEVADRVMKAGGPALLFEKPVGPPHRLTTPDPLSAVMGHPSIHAIPPGRFEYAQPVAINTMGSRRRMSIALSCEDFEEHADRLRALLKPEVPGNAFEALRRLPGLFGEVKTVPPKTVKSGICQ